MSKQKLKELTEFFRRRKYEIHNYMDHGKNIEPEPGFKKALFPSGEVILKYKDNKQEEILDQTKRVLLGVNTFDLKALALWDQAFEKDVYWQAKKQNTIIIGRQITPLPAQDASFFFETFEEDTLEHTKFDIFLLGDKKYKVFSGSAKGQKILDDFGYKDYEHVDFMGPVREEGLDENILKIRSKLKEKYLKKIWRKYGQMCVECGQCSHVCPTCFCFKIVDKPGLRPGEGTKVREWSSCLFPIFSEVAGGHKFQKETAERLYFWYYHKFVRTPEEFGMPGCVGCGRCTKACPVDIDIKKVLAEIINGK